MHSYKNSIKLHIHFSLVMGHIKLTNAENVASILWICLWGWLHKIPTEEVRLSPKCRHHLMGWGPGKTGGTLDCSVPFSLLSGSLRCDCASPHPVLTVMYWTLQWWKLWSKSFFFFLWSFLSGILSQQHKSKECKPLSYHHVLYVLMTAPQVSFYIGFKFSQYCSSLCLQIYPPVWPQIGYQ